MALVELVEYEDMRFFAYEGGRWSGDRRIFWLVFNGGRLERLGFDAGL